MTRQVLIDLTTSYPIATREIAAQAKAMGREYVDGGMTGGAKAADAGTITLMVGGSQATVDTCPPSTRADRGQGIPGRRDRHRPRPSWNFCNEASKTPPPAIL